jgi:hypothetical protein
MGFLPLLIYVGYGIFFFPSFFFGFIHEDLIHVFEFSKNKLECSKKIRHTHGTHITYSVSLLKAITIIKVVGACVLHSWL